jgi:uncharacterized protein (DUF1330 family)
MPKAYVIVDMDVTNPEQYAKYAAAAAPAVAAYGGRYLARGGATVVLEGGATPHRSVILEFDSLTAAEAWYRSPEYTAARALRDGAGRGTFIAVEGVEHDVIAAG